MINTSRSMSFVIAQVLFLDHSSPAEKQGRISIVVPKKSLPLPSSDRFFNALSLAQRTISSLVAQTKLVLLSIHVFQLTVARPMTLPPEILTTKKEVCAAPDHTNHSIDKKNETISAGKALPYTCDFAQNVSPTILQSETEAKKSNTEAVEQKPTQSPVSETAEAPKTVEASATAKILAARYRKRSTPQHIIDKRRASKTARLQTQPEHTQVTPSRKERPKHTFTKRFNSSELLQNQSEVEKRACRVEQFIRDIELINKQREERNRLAMEKKQMAGGK